MSDTKRMEMVAENLIAHFLQRHQILVAKPHFDQEGGDLFAITTEGGLRFCRIQCKGRTVRPSAGSSVEISVKLNLESLIVCLFVDDGSFDKLNLFVFFADDIVKWPKNSAGDRYVINLAHGTFADALGANKVSEKIVERISNEIMKAKLPITATYKYTGSGGIAMGGSSPAAMK